MAGQVVQDVMTRQLSTLPESATVTDAAIMMRDQGIGDVLVLGGNGQLRALITDRDLVVRSVATKADPGTARAIDAASGDLVTVGSSESVEDAAERMRTGAVRRLPVVDEDQNLMGMVSIGDLALEQDPRSALADISGAPANM